MAGYVWDFFAPPGQQLKTTEDYERERRQREIQQASQTKRKAPTAPKAPTPPKAAFRPGTHALESTRPAMPAPVAPPTGQPGTHALDQAMKAILAAAGQTAPAAQPGPVLNVRPGEHMAPPAHLGGEILPGHGKTVRPLSERLERIGDRFGQTLADYLTLHNWDVGGLFEPKRQHFPTDEAYEQYLAMQRQPSKAGLIGYDEQGRAVSETAGEQVASLLGGAVGITGPFAAAGVTGGAGLASLVRGLTAPKALATSAQAAKAAPQAAPILWGKTGAQVAEMAARHGGTLGTYGLMEVLLDPHYKDLTPGQKAAHVGVMAGIGAAAGPLLEAGAPAFYRGVIRGEHLAAPEIRFGTEVLKPERAKPFPVQEAVEGVPGAARQRTLQMWELGNTPYRAVKDVTGDGAYSLYRLPLAGEEGGPVLVRQGLKNEGAVIAATRDAVRKEAEYAERMWKGQEAAREAGREAATPPEAVRAIPEQHPRFQRGERVNVTDTKGNLVTEKPRRVIESRYRDGQEYVRVEGTKTYFPAGQVEKVVPEAQKAPEIMVVPDEAMPKGEVAPKAEAPVTQPVQEPIAMGPGVDVPAQAEVPKQPEIESEKIVAYHGTNKPFEKLDVAQVKTGKVFFSPKEHLAEAYQAREHYAVFEEGDPRIAQALKAGWKELKIEDGSVHVYDPSAFDGKKPLPRTIPVTIEGKLYDLRKAENWTDDLLLALDKGNHTDRALASQIRAAKQEGQDLALATPFKLVEKSTGLNQWLASKGFDGAWTSDKTVGMDDSLFVINNSAIKPTQAPSAEPKASAKEPWEMTREAYRQSLLRRHRELEPDPEQQGVIYDDNVELLKQAYREGAPVPPIVAFRTKAGRLQIIEGHHRYEAARAAGIDPEVVVIPEARAKRELKEQARVELEGDAANRFNKAVSLYHKRQIEGALSEGKPVPPEVLKDYPDLVKPETKAIPTTEAEAVARGVEPMMQRQENAGNRFVETVMEQFGFTKDEAETILGVYQKNKVVKLDSVTGQYQLKDGRFMERGPMERALEQAKPAAKPAEKPEPGKTKPEAALPLSVALDDVPYQLAYDAHRNSSFTPDKRAKQEQQEYVDHMQNLYERLASLAKTPEQQAILAEELARYKDGYLKRLKLLLGAQSRTASAMITGPAKFPTASNQKALDVADKRLKELLEWRDNAQAAIKKRVAPEESKVISSDDPNAPERLREKIAKAEERQDMMRRANLIVKNKKFSDDEKVAKLVTDLGMKEVTARKLLEPDELRRVGFPDYELRNNSANIRRMKERLADLDKKRAQDSKEIAFEGGRIVDSVEDNRVQVIFDTKEQGKALKDQFRKHGFVWAPSNSAWQRKRSDGALHWAREIVGATGKLQAPPTMPSVLKADLEMVAAERFHKKTLDTPGSKVWHQEKGFTGTIVDPKTVGAEAHKGKAMVRHEYEGAMAERWYDRNDLWPVEVPPELKEQFPEPPQPRQVSPAPAAKSEPTMETKLPEFRFGPSIKEALEALDKSGAKGSYYLRWDAKDYAPGDALPLSRRWVDEAPTDQVLAGTSVINPRYSKFTNHELATKYEGNVYLVQGKRVRAGQDPGEVILKDARVVQKITATKAPERGPLPPQREVEVTGRTATAKTERGTAIDTQYAVVEAGNLITSHDTALKANAGYPAELQPRDRARIASRDQITRMIGRLEPEFLGESPKASEGAPIVGPDMVVESGNARTIALKTIYERRHGAGKKYREWLENHAERFGLDKAELAKVENPVLVRVRQSDTDRVQFVREANEQAVAAMSASEQAQADADKISGGLLEMFVPQEDGNVISRQNWDFVVAFMDKVVGPAERGRYVTADGSISQEGAARIRNAVFARAYGDPAAIAKLAESTDSNIRNITNAMLMAAPRLAKLKEGIKKGSLYDLDLTGDVTAAANKLSTLREQNMAVERYLQQTSLFGEELSPLAKDILKVFDEHKRSGKKLTSFLLGYAERVEALGDPRQTAIFEQGVTPTMAEVLQAAIRKVEDASAGEGYQATLFQGAAPGRPADRALTGEGRPAAGEPARVLKTANDVAEALKYDWNRVTLDANINAPEELADQLADRVRGWEATRNPDGSITFARPADRVLVREVQGVYERVQQRDPAFKETAVQIATQVLADTFAKPKLSVVRGAIPAADSGVRTVGVGIRRDLIKEGTVSLTGHQVRTADELAVLAQILRDPRYETLRVFYVDGEGRILAEEALTSRLPNVVRVTKDPSAARYMWQMQDRIRRLKAEGVYLMHNHPSGDPYPSSADVALTKAVARHLGDKLRGHVVINSGKYASIERAPASSLLRDWEVEVRDLPGGKNQDALLSAEIPHDALNVRLDPEKLAHLGKTMQAPEGFVSVLYLDAKLKVRAIQEVPVGLFKREKDGADFMRGQARTFGAAEVAAVYRGRESLREIAEKHILNGVLLDAVLAEGMPTATVRRRMTETGTLTGPMEQAARQRFVGRDAPKGPVRVREDKMVGLDYILKQAGVKVKTGTERKYESDLRPKPQVYTPTRRVAEPRKLEEANVDEIRSLPSGVMIKNPEYVIHVFDLARELGSAARYTHLKKALGQFDYQEPGREAIHLATVQNLPTLAHETGHALDYRLSGGSYPPSIRARFPEAKATEKALRDELEQVTRIMRPTDGPLPVYRKRHTELMADFYALYLLDPKLAKAKAPTMTGAFEERLERRPKLKAEVESIVSQRDVVPEGRPGVNVSNIKPVGRPRQMLPDDITDPTAATRQMVLNMGRIHRSEVGDVMQRVSRWERQLTEEQLEDIGAAVEKISNLRTGKTYEQITKDLTPQQRTIMREYRYYQELLREDINKFLRELTGNDYINYIDDYLAHYYVSTPKKRKEFVGRWIKESPNAKARAFPTLAEAMDAGFVPLSQNVAALQKKWAGLNWRVALNRAFVHELKNIRDAEGRPVIMKPKDAPENWPVVDHPAIRQVYAKKRPDGTLELWHGGAALHPDVEHVCKQVFQQPFTHNAVKAIENLNAYAKKMQLTLSLFHHWALTESGQAMMARLPGLDPKIKGSVRHPFRGILLVGPKEETMGTGIRIPGTEWNITLPHRAGMHLMDHPEFMRDLHLEGGVIVGKGHDVQPHKFHQLLQKWEAKTRGVPGLGFLTQKLRQANQWWDNALWEHYHSGLKAYAYYDLMREWVQGVAPKDVTGAQIKEAKEKLGHLINDAFGGQEWERYANQFWATPQGRQLLHIGLLAPDWTISNFRMGWRTIKDIPDPFSRRLTLRYWRNMFLFYGMVVATATYAIHKKWPWEMKLEPEHKIDINVTPIMQQMPWVDKDEERQWYIRPGKQWREVTRYLTNLPGILGSKASPLVHQVFDQFSAGLGYGHWPSPWDDQRMGFWESVPLRVKNMAESFKPFSVRGNQFAFAFPMSRGMGAWRAQRGFEDLIGAQVDPTLYQQTLGKKDADKMFDELVNACEMNGLNAIEMWRQANTQVRGRYYSKMWQAIENEKWTEVERVAGILVELGVEWRQLEQSGQRRDRPPEHIDKAAEAMVGVVKGLTREDAQRLLEKMSARETVSEMNKLRNDVRKNPDLSEDEKKKSIKAIDDAARELLRQLK